MSDVRQPALPTLPPPWHTPEREALQQQVRAFARDEVLPVANRLDPEKGLIPEELLARMGELGYFGITIGTEHGGLGLGAFEYCMVAEELARAWMSVASIIARAQGLGTGLADSSERERLLRLSAKGEWIGAIALSEPDAGSDLASVHTRAVREGDEYVLTGQKRWCGNAKAADFIQILCRTRDPEEGESRSAGLETLLLSKPRGEFVPGLTGRPIDKIGYHGFLTWDLELDGVRIPAGNVVTSGEQEGGFSGVGAWLDIARVHTAARAVGLAQAAVEDCTVYLQEREQFGHPISDFQALRFALADMASEVEQSRAMYRQVSHLLDQGITCTREAAMAKLRATEMAATVTTQAMQLHGGNGYTTERQVERYWRDARLTTIFEGTSEIQRKIISDSMLPRPQQ
ncbi:acyl-CoA dehydrogenase family protein [Rhodococcus sp. X156]|uniref:acyl-CoA dehydrogenase family protein n=1 Tax=Rhodococcus sp. X156 TaxID=2499145 RepID=UPI000FDA1A44|nr:acyl-CoA dehydrogenase family protein [Rhodococcus sp. X156]